MSQGRPYIILAVDKLFGNFDHSLWHDWFSRFGLGDLV